MKRACLFIFCVMLLAMASTGCRSGQPFQQTYNQVFRQQPMTNEAMGYNQGGMAQGGMAQGGMGGMINGAIGQGGFNQSPISQGAFNGGGLLGGNRGGGGILGGGGGFNNQPMPSIGQVGQNIGRRLFDGVVNRGIGGVLNSVF